MSQPEGETHDSLTAEEPGGFTQVPDSLLTHTSVSDGAYRLYALLKYHARAQTSAWPGRKMLAKELGVRSVRTVDARIAELRELGYLVVTPRFHELGGQRSNLYHLRFYPVQNSAPPPSNHLHGPGATKCEAPVQPAASQRSTPLEGKPTPTRRRDRSATPRRSTTTSGGREGEGMSSNSGPAKASANPELVPGSEYIAEFLNRIPSTLWPQGRAQRTALEALLANVQQTWPARELADALLVGRPLPENVTHPIGLLRSRIEQLPTRKVPTAWPQWCGRCDERTRLVENAEADTVIRCTRCHPLAASQTKESA